MSKIFFFFTLICGLCFTSAEAFAKNFVSGFEDIPLMEGLKQIESDDIAFGNEETRYLEAQLVAVRKKNSHFHKPKAFLLQKALRTVLKNRLFTYKKPFIRTNFPYSHPK